MYILFLYLRVNEKGAVMSTKIIDEIESWSRFVYLKDLASPLIGISSVHVAQLIKAGAFVSMVEGEIGDGSRRRHFFESSEVKKFIGICAKNNYRLPNEMCKIISSYKKEGTVSKFNAFLSALKSEIFQNNLSKDAIQKNQDIEKQQEIIKKECNFKTYQLTVCDSEGCTVHDIVF